MTKLYERPIMGRDGRVEGEVAVHREESLVRVVRIFDVQRDEWVFVVQKEPSTMFIPREHKHTEADTQQDWTREYIDTVPFDVLNALSECFDRPDYKMVVC